MFSFEDFSMDKEYTDLGILFQTIICDLKGSYPLWDDLTKQCSKFNSTLKLTIMGMSSFIESFQKLADFAMDVKGGPRDLGSSLIKLGLRHRALESHLKSYSNALVECLVVPLQEKMDEWKKNALQLDKDHGKECKKMQVEVKKASIETLKLQKKVNKGKPEAKPRLESSTRDFAAKLSALEQAERNAIVSAITEHRSRFSFLVGCVKPVVAHETAMLGELENFKDIMCILEGQVANPSGMIDQTFVDAMQGFHMTMERKKRSIKEEAEFMGTISRSSSLSSHKSEDVFAKSAAETMASCPNSAQYGPTSALPRPTSNDPQQSHAFAMTVDDGFFFHQEFATLEKSRTISPEEQLHSSQRPHLTVDTFVPPPGVQQQQMQQQFLQSRQHSFPSQTSLSSNSSAVSNASSTKKVEKIYARPALVRREGSMTAPMFVAPPTVPNLPAGKHKQTTRDEADISALNQVMLDLERSTKLLEASYPGPAMSLQSLQSMQSMQCSSGYGTMTNVSSNSVETVQSISELDALLETSLSDLEKCSTLPLKRFNHSSKIGADSRRPASSSDEVPGCNGNVWQQNVSATTARQTNDNFGDDLPPPPDDFLLPNDTDPFPLAPQHLQPHQQKELNASLRHRFSQMQQNLSTLQEHHQHIPRPDAAKPCPPLGAEPQSKPGFGSSPPELPTSDFSALLRNVSLRKTIVNDRSAPILKKI